jgi:hypothetical protein
MYGFVTLGFTPGMSVFPFAWRTRFAGQLPAVAAVFTTSDPTVWKLEFTEVEYVKSFVLNGAVVIKAFCGCLL